MKGKTKTKELQAQAGIYGKAWAFTTTINSVEKVTNEVNVCILHRKA